MKIMYNSFRRIAKFQYNIQRNRLLICATTTVRKWLVCAFLHRKAARFGVAGLRLPIAALAILASIVGVANAAPASTISETVVIDYLQNAADITFTPEEREAILAAERRLIACEPAARQAIYAEASNFLKEYRAAKAPLRGYARHAARATFHYAKAEQRDMTAYNIVEKRDPVIIEDAPRKEIVTAADVRAIAASNALMGRLSGIEPPDSRLTPSNLAELRQAYATSEGGRLTLTQASLRYALVQAIWQRLQPASQAEIERVIREKVKTSDNVAEAAREMENLSVKAMIKARENDQTCSRAINSWARGYASVTMAMMRFNKANILTNEANWRFRQ